jgi:hypothetical protein
MNGIVVIYSAYLFYVGQSFSKFVFSKDVEISIVSHISLHLLSSFGGIGVIYMRAFKNGREFA